MQALLRQTARPHQLRVGVRKVADVVDDIRVNGFKNIGPKAQTAWNRFTEGAGNLASSAYNKVTNFFKGFTVWFDA